MKKCICLILSLTIISGCAISSLEEISERAAEDVVANDKTPSMHAMRNANQSIEDARDEINDWIRFNFKKAFAYKSKGNNEMALFHYHAARHTMRDSTSPVSNDENGNPAIIATSKPPAHNVPSKHVWRDKVDEDAKMMFDNNYVPSGDLLRMYGIDTENGPINRPNQLPRPNIVKR
jgi:hypothetical protein